MCLLIAVDKAAPKDRKMFDAAVVNADGAGIAWLDGDNVRWFKSMDAERVIRKAGEVEPPFLVHFRWSTVGGRTVELCHPFPVSARVGVHATGRARQVLAHNGHVHDWKDELVRIAAAGRHRIPGGPWSDTRAMAWVAHHIGPAYLDLLDEKVVTLDATDGLILYGGGWSRVGGSWFSNRSDRRWTYPATGDACVTGGASNGKAKAPKAGAKGAAKKASGGSGKGSASGSKGSTKAAAKGESSWLCASRQCPRRALVGSAWCSEHGQVGAGKRGNGRQSSSREVELDLQAWGEGGLAGLSADSLTAWADELEDEGHGDLCMCLECEALREAGLDRRNGGYLRHGLQ